MPRLRRLNGKEVVGILEQFGFEVVRVRGSHHHMKRILGGTGQNINIPVRGKKILKPGILHSIFRQACTYIPEEELRPYFYAD